MSARYARTVLIQDYDIDLFGTGATAGFRSESPNSPTCTHRARCISSRQEDGNALLNYLNAAFETVCPSKSCKLVLIVLANHANEKGECWPSVGRISRHTGLTDRGVQLALKDLNDKGFIEITRKTGRNSHYLVKMTPEASSPPPPKQLHPTPEASSPKPSYNHHNKQTPIVPLNTKTQPLLIPESQAVCDISEKIYQAYPRKVGKPAALRAIRKAMQKFDPEWLLEQTKAYAECRNGEPERFTPHPATWFNQERFNDDPSVWNPNRKQKKPSKTPEEIVAKQLRIQEKIRKWCDEAPDVIHENH